MGDQQMRLYKAAAPGTASFVEATVIAGSEEQANRKIAEAWAKITTIEDQTIDGVEFKFLAEPNFDGSEFYCAKEVNLSNPER